MRSEEKGRYEMLWDCPGCGTEKLLGLTHRHCPSCGAPQDPTRRYFPDDSEAIAVEDHPYQGADVSCAACDTPNAAKAAFCTGCGSPLEGAKTVAVRAEQKSEGGFKKDSATDAAKEAEEARQAARKAAHEKQAVASGVKPASKGGGVFKGVALVGCLGMAGLAIVGILVFFFWKKDATVVVTGHTWERTIAIETFSPSHESAWSDKVPSNAYNLSCHREQRDTRKVPDGETCRDKRQDKGDGTYTVVQECTTKYRSEPVYDDKCDYTVDKWQVTKTERAAGSALIPAPTWPTVTIALPGNCLGCQREGAHAEKYTVQLAESESKAAHTCDLAQPAWGAMAVGSRWQSKVGVVSGMLDCDELKAR